MSDGESVDVVVIGAGPAGLCCAKGLAKSGFRVAVVERQPQAALAEPAFDGREIALTHRSLQILRGLSVWPRIPAGDISPIKRADVSTGTSPRRLRFDHLDTPCAALGYLVPNHAIRRAAYEAVAEEPAISLFAGQDVASVRTDHDSVTVRSSGGRAWRAPLLVAADSRFSDTRRGAGIAADMVDFGKCMLVCRMQHDQTHDETARECFFEHCTVASLPLNGNESSLVVTVSAAEARRLQELAAADFSADIEAKFQARLGSMRLSSTRHVYPLVATFARRFVGPRFALVGDAAVGMHPVTAHGFNLGLRSQDTLTESLRRAAARGGDIGSAEGLLRYESLHRRHARPLYLATNAIVRLYTDPRPLAALVRRAALEVADRFAPFKHAALAALTEANRLGN